MEAAAAALGISVQTIARWRRAGRIRVHRVGERVRVPIVEVERLLDPARSDSGTTVLATNLRSATRP